MKYVLYRWIPSCQWSPSMRREWIEMRYLQCYENFSESPSMRREWIEMHTLRAKSQKCPSPSMRREWIEIPLVGLNRYTWLVSLHAEGVD